MIIIRDSGDDQIGRKRLVMFLAVFNPNFLTDIFYRRNVRNNKDINK